VFNLIIMQNKKKKSDQFFYTFLIVTILLFVFFLTRIPYMINGDQINYHDEDINQINSNSNPDEFLQKTKFEIITNSIMEDLTTIKIKNSYNSHILKLVEKNDITNRDNTIAQEIITLYLSNKSTQAKELTKYFIEEKLNTFDSRSDWRWRNHALILQIPNSTETLYNISNLLIGFEDAKTQGYSIQNVSLYEYQVFYFTFPDGLTKTITLNIFTKQQSGGNLSEYIDVEYGNKPKVDLRSIKSDFLKSKDSYTLQFMIWE